MDEVAGRRPGLSEQLAESLLALIAGERLAPGDALPTVRALAERLDVTAPTIREALRRLEATDAVRLRHGSGIYVGPGVLRTLMPNPNPIPVDGAQVLFLVEARLAIEPGVAALAARHRSAEQLARLEASATPGAEAGSGAGTAQGSERRKRANFHRELAGACGNPVLYEVVDSLLAARAGEQRALRRLVPDRARDLDQHWAIFEAVRDRDAELAEELTRSHLIELRENTAAQVAETD
ncbi:FadR/GntR family transcriptional regulator [Catenulispora pinisilvae]|uniref:FadR/GntR family transcriptional regulator n=1 Tax=Catenulispora pinisilvae TaxID=2705253 RepID=UPI002B27741A|nr:FCD domain-containing protein [Catenulispora pinisilvae]